MPKKSSKPRTGGSRRSRIYHSKVASAKVIQRAFRSKRKAYAPSNKRFVKRLTNPLAENKQITGSELSAYVGVNAAGGRIFTDMSVAPANQSGHRMNTTNFIFIPDFCNYQTHGLDENQMTGRSTYQTLCAAKFLFKWPQSTMKTGVFKYGVTPNTDIGGRIPDQAMSYKLYWGFVPYKHMLTGQTTPTGTNVSAVELETVIKNRISDYFDSRQDRIQFIPKKTSTINIIGSKVLSAPQYHLNRMAVSGNSNPPNPDGNIPDTLVKIKWPMNRKIHFEPTNNISGDGSSQPAGVPTVFYRNYDHIPFACVVSWNHNKLPEDDSTATDPDDRFERTQRTPQVLINDITYYRDS